MDEVGPGFPAAMSPSISVAAINPHLTRPRRSFPSRCAPLRPPRRERASRARAGRGRTAVHSARVPPWKRPSSRTALRRSEPPRAGGRRSLRLRTRPIRLPWIDAPHRAPCSHVPATAPAESGAGAVGWAADWSRTSAASGPPPPRAARCCRFRAFRDHARIAAELSRRCAYVTVGSGNHSRRRSTASGGLPTSDGFAQPAFTANLLATPTVTASSGPHPPSSRL